MLRIGMFSHLRETLVQLVQLEALVQLVLTDRPDLLVEQDRLVQLVLTGLLGLLGQLVRLGLTEMMGQQGQLDRLVELDQQGQLELPQGSEHPQQPLVLLV